MRASVLAPARQLMRQHQGRLVRVTLRGRWLYLVLGRPHRRPLCHLYGATDPLITFNFRGQIKNPMGAMLGCVKAQTGSVDKNPLHHALPS